MFISKKTSPLTQKISVLIVEGKRVGDKVSPYESG